MNTVKINFPSKSVTVRFNGVSVTATMWKLDNGCRSISISRKFSRWISFSDFHFAVEPWCDGKFPDLTIQEYINKLGLD